MKVNEKEQASYTAVLDYDNRVYFTLENARPEQAQSFFERLSWVLEPGYTVQVGDDGRFFATKGYL